MSKARTVAVIVGLVGFLFVIVGVNARIYNPVQWFDAAWGEKYQITIPASSINETLTNFPVYLDLADFPSSFHVCANDDFFDLRILDSNEAIVLNHELVAASSTAQTGEVYFNSVSLSSTTDNIFYAYCGNSGASDTSTSSAWNSNYKGVYHLEATGNDSTSNANNLTVTGATATTTGAMFGQAYSFDGNDFIEADIVVSGGSFPFTFQAWVKVSNVFGVPMWQGDKDVQDVWQRIGIDNGIAACFSQNGGTSARIDGDTDFRGVYQRITCGFTASNDRELFVNAVSKGTSAVNVAIGGTDRTSIGRNARASAGDFIQGEIDEVRILDVIMTPSWLLAEYNNMATTTEFYRIGIQESFGSNLRISL